MKISVIGARGIPATYGGIEKHCEEIYTRLAEKGHEITIYARQNYLEKNLKEYKGINIKNLWTFKSKGIEASFHTLISCLHELFNDSDIVHFHAQGPCMFAWIIKLFNPQKQLFFTCHGIDWQRNKWSKFAKLMIKFGEKQSGTIFDTQIVVSESLANYYRHTYNKTNPVIITNGTNIEEQKKTSKCLKKFKLSRDNYMVFVGRLVPEKAPHRLIEAYLELKTNKKLVIVGDSAATDDYVNYMKNIAKNDKRIIFTSYLYGDELAEIYSNADLYISTSELEGLPLTLLEAMSYGIPALVSPIDPHIEVIGNEEYGYLFDSLSQEDIKNKLEYILSLDTDEIKEKGQIGKQKINRNHNWNAVTKKLEMLYQLT
ncbi:MAG: glycosyltransferase family 4 protein [bacterium]